MKNIFDRMFDSDLCSGTHGQELRQFRQFDFVFFIINLEFGRMIFILPDCQTKQEVSD